MSVNLLSALAAGDTPGWPDAGQKVAKIAARREADHRVLSCWTGMGISRAAYKVPEERAALCTDAATDSWTKEVKARQHAGHGTTRNFERDIQGDTGRPGSAHLRESSKAPPQSPGRLPLTSPIEVLSEGESREFDTAMTEILHS